MEQIVQNKTYLDIYLDRIEATRIQKKIETQKTKDKLAEELPKNKGQDQTAKRDEQMGQNDKLTAMRTTNKSHSPIGREQQYWTQKP